MVFKSLPFLLLYFLCFSCGTGGTTKKQSINTKSIIQSLKKHEFSDRAKNMLLAKINEISDAQNNNNEQEAKQHLFEYNKLFETEYTKAFIKDHDLGLVERKYQYLKERRFDAEKDETSSSANARLNGLKIPDMSSKDPFVYNPEVLEQVLKVYKDYGRLYIKETKGVEEAVAKKTPWSGHWYPFSRNDLYKGKDSPLGKFDKLVTFIVGYNSKARPSQESLMKGLGAASWEGLCDAWAFASVVTDEPTQAKIISGINFSIADQKALLTFSHLKYPYTQYGIQYTGCKDTDGTYEDIKPEAFHRVITSVVGEEGRAVIIDDMAGVEVWNKPLYKYRWRVEKDPKVKNAYLVTAYTSLVKERAKESDKLTNRRDIIAPNYLYRLHVDKNIVKDGKFLVVAGEWIGRSITDHPDNIKVPHTKGRLGSHNPEFNKNLKIIERYFLNS